jgi:cytochrome c-type biogenesis protein CcmH/NrfG
MGARRIVLAAALAAALAVPSAQARAPYGDVFSPNDPASEPYRIAREAIEAERWSEAEAALARVARLAPDVPDVWSLTGLAIRKQGRLDEAERAYARALALEPEHLRATSYLGELFLQRGDVAAARGQLERLQAICPPLWCPERDDLARSIAAAGG